MEQWVTPGRYQVPHLETTYNAATGTWTIGEVNTNPFNYPALSVDSQAYKNINTGVPTDFNQFEGCPVGHKMGPDGVCRPITGYKGPELPEATLPVGNPGPFEPTPDDPTDPTDPFQNNQYNKEPDAGAFQGSVRTSKQAHGNDYSALPGGFNNWSNEVLYDYGLDKGYFTEDSSGFLLGPMQVSDKFKNAGFLGSMAGSFGQMGNDKQYEAYVKSATEKGLLRESRNMHPTEGVQSSYQLNFTRGDDKSEWGGGQLKPIEKANSAENAWSAIVNETYGPSADYQKTLVTTGKMSDKVAPIINDKPDEWWTNVYNKWLTGEYGYQDKDYGDNNFPDELNTVATDSDIMPALDFYGRIDKTQTNYFGESNTIYSPNGELAPAFRQFKQHILGNANSFDNDGLKIDMGVEEKTFDPLLGKFVTSSTGLDQEAERRRRSKKLLVEQKTTSQQLKKPSLLIGTYEGNKANNMTTANYGQYIGAAVYKSPKTPDNTGKTSGGGHYQQNGKFVGSDGTVNARGSMSDSIYAMANGTAVDSVLDRTLKNKNSVKVMNKEALKMKEAGKLSQAEYDKVTGYNNKSDYENDKGNKVIHENGIVTEPSKVTYTGPPGGGTSTKQAEQSQSGNTGSGSKDDDKIICTEMYRQTNLNDWKEAMKLWYVFQKKHLTPTHQVGYHFLFKPFVRGMKKSKILTAIGSHFAKQRTKDIKHIMFGTKFSLLGRAYRIIFEPICYVTGLLLTYKEKLAWQ